MSEPLLIEIGCEEIPARMIPAAAAELGRRVDALLERAGFSRGATRVWGGTRRLAVRVDDVAARLEDREELVSGPPVSAAYGEDGRPTKAAIGFARKQGIDPGELQTIETERGTYVGFRRAVTGETIGETLARDLPGAVAGMSFPKSMRWGEGTHRWVRPVHRLLALHGDRVLELSLFDVAAGRESAAHRFLHDGPVAIARVEEYESALEAGKVLIDPQRRRRRLAELLDDAARQADGRLVADAALLDEVADLVEWPGVAIGRFDAAFLDLPRELLVTTLRHHQKCFSVQREEGSLLPAFLAVANTDRDPAGHVRRGNEWVVGGRLDDARFFWNEDRKSPLADRAARLEGVVFHARGGTYADRAISMAGIADALARAVGLDAAEAAHCAHAARLCKIDLVTGTVGEFPELQGQVGGLLLRAEGEHEAVAAAVYEHYRPEGPDDDLPATDAGCVVAVADKLDAAARLLAAGERPTGSRDPFGLRRAAGGIFRICIERGWPTSVGALLAAARAGEGVEVSEPLAEFLVERLQNHLRERGATVNEISAVLRTDSAPAGARRLEFHDVAERLGALGGIRERSDFAHLVDLTKRVDNILTRNAETFAAAESRSGAVAFDEDLPAALELARLTAAGDHELKRLEDKQDYRGVVELLASFVAPVEEFFHDVLVIDPDRPGATLARRDLLIRLRGVLTRCFDIRELAGQAERRE